ncbi:hypothetical protein WICMUC_001831 [Wickerhamomyces mucosus]|uniref:Amine oxidase n=1 Tax=Wickerhamomyces mucosus TaxID=1378264 RepID=A0A9P8TG26_9ASCO|nr:hypothetical protein WICMUC_001831 [Wickerhamomyces mucosus]
MPSTSAKRTKVIIVGGGISGIKAALELQKHGLDYIILEAKDRLGGRLNTVQGINTKYDLGASWYHETLNNPLFDEEVNLSVEGEEPKWFYDDAPIKVINENGVLPPFLKLESIAQEILKFIEIENYKDLEKDQSLYDTVVKYMKLKKHLLSTDQILQVSQYIRSLELWHGIDSKSLSSKFSSVDNEGRNALALHYDTLLKRHTEKLDFDKVILESPIKSLVKTERGKKVEAITEANDCIKGDYAIVAIPQSILQIPEEAKGHIKFEPDLPPNIKASLKVVHYGALGKVIFEFSHCYWPTDSERILALSRPPEGLLHAIENDLDAPFTSNEIPKTWDYPTLILNYATSFKKNSLVMITQSPLTEYLERNPDKAWEFFKPVVKVIAQKASDAEIDLPINQIVSQWTLDPYQRGSYSACFPGDDPLVPIIALEQGFGNIRFAGEHTILEGAGCVHGAWNSGIREAQYIIDQTIK